MLKFIGGVAIGAAMALGYVHWNASLPAVIELPGKLRGNLVSTAVEAELYSFTVDAGTRQRALEVFFANRAEFAARIDADHGHPFLAALHRTRAVREAGQIAQQWSAFDVALSKAALREAMEKKYGSDDDTELKQHMLASSLSEHPFLAAWIENHMPAGSANHDQLLATLRTIRAAR